MQFSISTKVAKTKPIFTLPAASTAKRIIRAAIKRGALQAQQPDFEAGFSFCRYEGPCAIGVLMPPHVRQVLDNCDTGGATTIGRMISEGVVKLRNPDDERFYRQAQYEHDCGDIEALKALTREVTK